MEPALRLNLVVIRSLQPQTTVEFYERLGIAFQSEQHGAGPRHWVAKPGDVVLEIYPAKTPADVDSTTRLGFRAADLQSLVLTFQPSEIVQPMKQSEWGIRAVVLDPDGRRVEIVQDVS